jgi:Methyltransferase domain.
MYRRFAEVYDRLTQDIRYDKWADYLESAFLKFGKKPGLVLELACGTGSLTVELAKRGYDMIGLDLSCDMLSQAKEKSLKHGLDILFINQDMRSFELYGTVDAVICMLDSINYITEKSDLERVFSLIHMYLNPGGIFIFDINSEYKLSRILAGNTFYEISEDVAWIWNNTYDPSTRLCTFDLTFFTKTRGNLYARFDETHVERAYTDEEIRDALAGAKLKLAGRFGCLNFDPPSPGEERIFYIALKEPH